MLLSVLTLSYNSITTVEKTLSSVLFQSLEEFEYLVIDGGSIDGSLDLFSSFKSDNFKFISENDNGIYDALNKGIILSTGDIIGILHSDDIYPDPEILEKIVELFKRTNCDGVYGDLNFIKDGQTIRKWESCKFNSSLLVKGWMPAHPTLFLKREVFQKHGLYDISFKIAADYDFILRIFKDESLKFEYLPLVITNMSIGGVSTAGFKNLVRKSYEDWLVLKKNKMRFPLFILLRKIFSKLSQYYSI